MTDLQDRIRELEEEAARYRSLIQRLEARDTVTRIVVESASLAEAAPRVLRALCELLDWDIGILWEPDESRTVLRATHTWSAREFPSFAAASAQRSLAVGVGLPGRVWLDGEPAWIAKLDADDNFTRTAAAAKDGLTSAFAFPLMAGTGISGVVELFSASRREPDEALLDTFLIAGHQIGLFMQRRRAEQELERRARVGMLRADMAAALAKSAEEPAILRECTDALVKHLDVAFARVWTLDAAGKMLELRASSGLYTHVDGSHARIPVGAFKIGWIAEKRRPHVTDSVPEDPRVTDRAWALREGMRSFAGYPLLSENRMLGVLAMFSRSPMERFVLDELMPIADSVAQFLDRRKSEAELRRTQALKAGMLEAAFDAIVAINHHGRVLEFNSAAGALFGYERAEVMGRPIADLIIPPRFREAHWTGLARYLSTGEARVLGRRLELSAMRSDGTEFPVELAIVRIPGEDPPVFTAFLRALAPRENGEDESAGGDPPFR